MFLLFLGRLGNAAVFFLPKDNPLCAILHARCCVNILSGGLQEKLVVVVTVGIGVAVIIVIGIAMVAVVVAVRCRFWCSRNMCRSRKRRRRRGRDVFPVVAQWAW
eukprot:3949268-Pyramimonas_sp.AAC.2